MTRRSRGCRARIDQTRGKYLLCCVALMPIHPFSDTLSLPLFLRCRELHDRWATSIINQYQTTLYFQDGTGGIILSPDVTLFCAYPGDGDSQDKLCIPDEEGKRGAASCAGHTHIARTLNATPLTAAVHSSSMQCHCLTAAVHCTMRVVCVWVREKVTTAPPTHIRTTRC